ncbi:guanine nucleotide exchange factor MSS4 isoform X2 [Erinaceus europaeus]|uniref:Guanine nucleotide exchange factor MSS4 isoform X2 n=1 Tax=Erinaceus europaeus TaxID=9365 RepID=A0ABM3WDA3_ERIEU|nr:guanine nucleotide exchange factor MSS4 isoform X2 [Erinaceus europaeus]
MGACAVAFQREAQSLRREGVAISSPPRLWQRRARSWKARAEIAHARWWPRRLRRQRRWTPRSSRTSWCPPRAATGRRCCASDAARGCCSPGRLSSPADRSSYSVMSEEREGEPEHIPLARAMLGLRTSRFAHLSLGCSHRLDLFAFKPLPSFHEKETSSG